MFPLKDDNPSRSFPVVTTIFIVINLLVYLYELSVGKNNLQLFYNTCGLVPHHLLHKFSAHEVNALFTSMFAHAGIFHLLSNMWILLIFGDNVEDRMGHLGFFFFYLCCGVVATLLQVLSGQDAVMPIVGASGAIAGVLGAYLVLFPRACIISLCLIGIVPLFYPIPAIVYVGLWFFIELCGGLLHVATPLAGVQLSAVAEWAHVGGFVCGVLLVKPVVNLFEYRDWYPDEYKPW